MKRNFYPGESWLYYKIYCNEYISNEILLEPINKVATKLINEKIIDKWFFVRYKDPDFHIRLRFSLRKKDDILIIMNYVKNSLGEYLKEHQVWKLQIDTYQREIERYGGDCITAAEEIFFRDSVIAIDLLKQNQGDKFLILFGATYLHACLESFELNDEEKLAFVKQYNSYYQKEFEMSKNDLKTLNRKYQLLEVDIIRALADDNFKRILNQRAKDLELDIQVIKNSRIENFYNILGSLNHMGINRLFFNNQRFYEMICYDYLAKFYISKQWLIKSS